MDKNLLSSKMLIEIIYPILTKSKLSTSSHKEDVISKLKSKTGINGIINLNLERYSRNILLPEIGGRARKTS